MGSDRNSKTQLTLLLVVGCGQKSNSFKLLWLSLLPVRIVKVHLKRRRYSGHKKSFILSLDAQGQLTPQSEVDSALNSNSSKLVWLSLLPASMK